jgi:hypothetical protein
MSADFARLLRELDALDGCPRTKRRRQASRGGGSTSGNGRRPQGAGGASTWGGGGLALRSQDVATLE